LHLRASCGDTEVTPIHPFVLEHRIADKRVVREGLYVFSADALGPHCSSVTLTLAPDAPASKPDTIDIDPRTIAQIWEDLAAFRAPAM
jgi:hypothetical protein